jgi:pimeloyl-ACP methyl ester carboxylesterase
VALWVVLGTAVIALGAATVRVYASTHPGHREAAPFDFEAMAVRAEPVEFSASDGVLLRGWLLRRGPQDPPVVLCHDLGTSRGSLVGMAIALHKAGFTVLLFDFRGHGDSDGSRTTLGVLEKRDVLGAVEFLSGPEGTDATRVGLYGVGMGAHAAVLAAADLRQVKVLVLDSLYPDADFELIRKVYSGWEFGRRNLSFVPRTIFGVMTGTGTRSPSAAEVIGRLTGRDLLLLAPAGDSRLVGEMRRMYESIPDQADADGNLAVLPATRSGELYGEQLERYRERVADFFTSRLSRSRGRDL